MWSVPLFLFFYFLFCGKIIAYRGEQKKKYSLGNILTMRFEIGTALRKWSDGAARLFDGGATSLASAQESANRDVFEMRPVTLENVKARGSWKNHEGKRLRVNPEKLTAIDYTGGNELFFDDIEGIRSFLEREQYIFAPATKEADKGPTAEVISITASAGKTYPEKKKAKKGKGKNIDELIGGAAAGGGEGGGGDESELPTLALITKIKALLDEISDTSEVAGFDAIKSEALEIREGVDKVEADMQNDLTTSKDITEEMRQGYGERFQNFLDRAEHVVQSAKMLTATFSPVAKGEKKNNILKSGAGSSAEGTSMVDKPESMTVQKFDSMIIEQPDRAVGSGHQAAPGEVPEKPEGKAGDEKLAQIPGEPNESKEPKFSELLGTFQREVEELIKKIATPEDFVRFRGEFKVVERKDLPPERYILSSENFEESLRRGMTEEEGLRFEAIEKQTRKAFREKFLALNDADLEKQFLREKAMITQAPDETTLLALPEPHVDDIWKAVSKGLSKNERELVAEGCREKKIKLDAYRQRCLLGWRKEAARVELAISFNMANPVQARERVDMLEGLIINGYKDYVRDMRTNGAFSDEECWALWQENNGDAALKGLIVRYLHQFNKIDQKKGEEVFEVLTKIIRGEVDKKV